MRAWGIVVASLLVGGWLSLVVINWLKGKRWIAVFGLLGGLVILPSVTAIRLAKPGSWWARHRYDDAKLAAAAERFHPPLSVERDEEVRAAWEGEEIDPSQLDRITRRALRKAKRI